MTAVAPIPEGYHSVAPHLVVADAGEAIDFYSRAFGATEAFRMATPDGAKVMHAEIRIGDSPVMLAEEFASVGVSAPATLGGTSVTIHLYVDDVDKLVAQAEAAGAEVTMPPQDMFWGDRYARLKDPFGHSWSVATHIANPTPEEMAAAAKAMFSSTP